MTRGTPSVSDYNNVFVFIPQRSSTNHLNIISGGIPQKGSVKKFRLSYYYNSASCWFIDEVGVLKKYSVLIN
jgi:hypothetical protein